MGTPIVSVVVPTYQRRELVRRAVQSVLDQTFTDFELLVVDDGGNDATGAALQGLDPRLRYLWQENRGVSAARNAGIRLARGELVAFLDSDDRWLPDHLAVVTTALALRPEAVLCSTCPRFRIGGRESPLRAEARDALPLLLLDNVVGYPSGVAVRYEPLRACGAFDERLLVMEGRELWLRLALRGPFVLLSRRTIVYQSTRGSLTERSRRNGEYPRALDVVAESAGGVARTLAARGAPELRRRAEAGVAYLDALRALARRDDPAVAAALRHACEAIPELSREMQLVADRILLLAFGPAARLRLLADAAALWPDPACDTALYLRLRATAAAVRLGRVGHAAALLRGIPVRAVPRFALRLAPVLVRVGRRRLQQLLHRGREATASPPGSAALAGWLPTGGRDAETGGD